jgi:hypothetical protein
MFTIGGCMRATITYSRNRGVAMTGAPINISERGYNYPHCEKHGPDSVTINLGYDCCLNCDKEYLLAIAKSIYELNDLSILIKLSDLIGDKHEKIR